MYPPADCHPPSTTFPSSIVVPFSYVRARGIIKTLGPVTADAYVYFAMSSQSRSIPGGRRAENNKARLSSGTALPPLQLPSLDGLPPHSPPSTTPSSKFLLRSTYTAGVHSPFNLDPTYGSPPTRRRTALYVIFILFIVSRSHPRA